MLTEEKRLDAESVSTATTWDVSRRVTSLPPTSAVMKMLSYKNGSTFCFQTTSSRNLSFPLPIVSLNLGRKDRCRGTMSHHPQDGSQNRAQSANYLAFANCQVEVMHKSRTICLFIVWLPYSPYKIPLEWFTCRYPHAWSSAHLDPRYHMQVEQEWNEFCASKNVQHPLKWLAKATLFCFKKTVSQLICQCHTAYRNTVSVSMCEWHWHVEPIQSFWDCV